MTLSEWIDILLEIENRGHGRVAIKREETSGDPYIYAGTEIDKETKEEKVCFFI